MFLETQSWAFASTVHQAVKVLPLIFAWLVLSHHSGIKSLKSLPQQDSPWSRLPVSILYSYSLFYFHQCPCLYLLYLLIYYLVLCVLSHFSVSSMSTRTLGVSFMPKRVPDTPRHSTYICWMNEPEKPGLSDLKCLCTLELFSLAGSLGSSFSSGIL